MRDKSAREAIDIAKVKEGVWSSEWPVVPGWYWFYGLISNLEEKPELFVVKVRKAANGFIYTTENMFLFKAEVVAGIWKWLPEPEFPNKKPTFS